MSDAVAASAPQTPSFRLDGRRALVSGAGRGLGRAAAHALAQAGAQLCLVARSAEQIQTVRAEIEAAGGRAQALVLNVTDSAAVTRLVAEHGPFDILVNNAGTNRPAPLLEVQDADLDAIFDLNLKAAFYLAREVSRGLVAAGKPGSIINMSSQMGHVGSPRRSVYCASKHALEGMSKALAWELGPHQIRVNTVCPTFIETPLTAPMLSEPQFRSFVLSKIALGRLGRIEEVMGALVFLASDASSLVTGSALMVDGGWTAA